MNKADLKAEFARIEAKAKADQAEAIKKYCLSNNPYKVGDIFEDSTGKIVVEKIKIYYTTKDPCCVYYGLMVKRDGSPTKKMEHRDAYQCNDVRGEK